jgi:hypothetical protein
MELRLKVKGREAGVYSALQLEETDCTCTPWRSLFIHLQRRHHTKRRESPLLAKAKTFIEGILLTIRNLLQLLGSFTYRKVGTWDRLFNFPSEGRHAEDFVHRKNPKASAGFEPANQRPSCEPRDHRSRLWYGVDPKHKLVGDQISWKSVVLKHQIYWQGDARYVYRYAPHNDVSVNDGPHIRLWFHNIKML